MKSGVSRRDFLKLAGAFPVGMAASQLSKQMNVRQLDGKKNVIIVVFDALSAYNMSLYGYGRDTTPVINKLAERAVVYHNHYAGSNYTSPGTASLLTGTLPWTHRAQQPNSKVIPQFRDKSMFSLFGDYHRMAYSHNEWVNTLFEAFKKDIDEWVPRLQLCLYSSDAVVQKFFGNDKDISSVSWARNAKIKEEGYAYSLFLSRLLSYLEEREIAEYKSEFPRGLPTSNTDNGFLLEHAIDWLADRVANLDEPTFGYFHFLPPHDPYRPPTDFFGTFVEDSFQPIGKPQDIFAEPGEFGANRLRAFYDEFILYVDQQFGRFYEKLEQSGILQDTILVLTSDHGESFERGIIGHDTDALYEPLVRVPLLIFDPDRTERLDIHTQTSVVDLLPTLAQLSKKELPVWAEGQILPPYAEQEQVPERAIYSVRAYRAEQEIPMKEASVTIMKSPYKLHYYYGYPELDGQEKVMLYNIEDDPEELDDLSSREPDVLNVLLAEVKNALNKADVPYL